MREEVLRAVLKADLIGFHTYDYARHFVSACTRILGLEVSTLSWYILLPQRRVHRSACGVPACLPRSIMQRHSARVLPEAAR